MPKNQSKKRARDNALIERWSSSAGESALQLGLSLEDISRAQRELVGSIIMPWDPPYDDTRQLSNPVFSPSPCMIVMCETETDVGIALSLAQKSGVAFTVRSGGHCTAGFSAGFGVLIDVKALDSVQIDPVGLRATVGAGCEMKRLNQALGTHGLHVPGGECDDVCIGGFVQGGGLGFTSTTFGMNCDNVISVRVMLGDGSIIIASEQQNYDLWWAIRGGTGGNFGILLSVTYQLYELGDVSGFALAWKMDTPAGISQAADVMILLQDMYMTDCPFGDQLTMQALWVYQTILYPGQAPLAEPVPLFMARGLWTGDPSEFEATMQPLLKMPGAFLQFTEAGPYATVLDSLVNAPQSQPIITDAMGSPNEEKASRYVATSLTAAQWVQIMDYFIEKSPNTLSYMYLEFYGGAIRTYPLGGSAFIHRTALYDAVLDVFWYAPRDRAAAEAFLDGWITLLETVWNGEVYQNYPSIKVPNYPVNYWGSALNGLVKVKAKYDQDRRFTFAQQIPNSLPEGYVPAELSAQLSAALALPVNHFGGVAASASRQ